MSVIAVWSGGHGWPIRIFGTLLTGYTLHGSVHLAAALVTPGHAFGAITALPAVTAYGASRSTACAPIECSRGATSPPVGWPVHCWDCRSISCTRSGS